MKRFLLLMAPIGLLLAGPALAQNDQNPGDRRRPRDPERMQQMLDRFDSDGDGELSREERQAAREARGDRQPGRREAAAEGDGPPRGPRGDRRAQGDRPGRSGQPGAERPRDGRGPGRGAPRDDADRGPGRGGPRGAFGPGPGRDGPPGPPNPEAMFDRFDENSDGQLSKDEFLALSRHMRRMGPGGPPPRGPRAGRNDFDRGGPPPGEFRRGRGPGEGAGRPRPETDKDN